MMISNFLFKRIYLSVVIGNFIISKINEGYHFKNYIVYFNYL